LVREKFLSLTQLVHRMSLGPAEILGLDRGHLSEGALADVTVFDPQAEWVVQKEALESKSKNSPFLGRTMKGKATDVFCEGRHVLQEGVIARSPVV
jgi:dihydroorotase